FLYSMLVGFFCGSLFGSEKYKNAKALYWDLIPVGKNLQQKLSPQGCKVSFFQLNSREQEKKYNELSLAKDKDENAWLLAYKNFNKNNQYLGKIVMPTASANGEFRKNLTGVIAAAECEKIKLTNIGIFVENFEGYKEVYGKIGIIEAKRLMLSDMFH